MVVPPYPGWDHDFRFRDPWSVHMTEPDPKPTKKATVQRINLLERAMELLTDDELPAKTEELKARLKKRARHMATDTKPGDS